MDYKVFYAEVVDWIMQVNQMATKHGFDSEAFWNWVTSSVSEICDRYKNNQLVMKQMGMLFEWLDDVYAEGLKQR